jgi:transcriptional regulator with GAF, ATPase, and Fis domain
MFSRRVARTHDIVSTRLDMGFSADGTCSTIASVKDFANMSAAGISIVPDYSLSQSDHRESKFTPRTAQCFWRGNYRGKRGELLNHEFEGMVGCSRPLIEVLDLVRAVAPTDSTVLIEGETGTGKELIARAVHKRSRRAGRAFVSVNCAALAPSLISSELFGHEKGAFTGATQRRLGRFELADGGTIFLDEVGELPPDTQVALLRVLQEREFERVGGAQSIRVNVRVIAATNRDLKAATASGTFRQDLFYRLNVFPIDVPPLRERKDDILMLVEYFVQCYASRAGKNIRSIDKKTLERFQSYHWPGNIRELQNIIERSVILSSGDLFSVDETWRPKNSGIHC